MFEGWFFQLVAGYLGNYIKDIHREQFRVGLWDGEALLKNVGLRLEAFDYLQLPFAIKEGHIGKLRLQIPWKTIFRESIVVALEDVYICACPREDSEFDVEASENRALAAKKAKLAAAEITKLSSNVSDENVRVSFFSHVIAKFIANIQVTVRNVHIRYVDEKEDPQRNIDFGAKLEGLTVATMEARGVAAKGNMVQKAVEIGKFSLYWNLDSASRKHKATGMNSWFQNEDTEPTYILKPLDASAKLTINRSSASEGAAAQYALAISIDKLNFNLESNQLCEVFLLLESFKISQLRERYGRFRPNTDISKSAKWQREWWHYAIHAVSSDVKKRLRRTSWKYLGWRLESRRRYVTLYKAKLDSLQQGDPPDDDVAAQLEALEKELDLDMILSFRSLAKEKCQLGTYVPNGDDGPEFYRKPGEDQNSSRVRGWLSLFSFGMLGGSGTMDVAAEVTEPFSDEIMKDLYKATNFHPTNGGWAKGDNFMTVNLQLREVIAQLKNSKTKDGLLEVTLEGLYANIRKLQNSTRAAAAVKTFTVTDLCTRDSAFRHIVSRKGFSDQYNTLRPKSYAQAVGITQRDLSEVVFSLEVDVSDDSRLKITVILKPLEVIYSPLVMLGLMDFFNLPPLYELDEEPETNIKAKSKLMLTADVKSPVILIPERNCDANCSILVMTLERLTILKVYDLKELSKSSSLVADLSTNTIAMNHFDVKLAGIQIATVEGLTHSSVSLAKIVDCFDAQAEFLQFRDVFGTHWKFGGDSGTISVALCAEKCQTLQNIVSSAFDNVQVHEGSQSSEISGHFIVRTMNVQVSMSPSTVIQTILLHLKQLELKVLPGEKREVSLSAMCFSLENMDVPKNHSLRCLMRTDTSVVFTHVKDALTSQMLLRIRNTQCEIYPKIIGAVSGFVVAASRGRSSPGESSGTSFTFRLLLEDVTLAFHASFGTIATMKLPRSSFSLSSDALFQDWNLNGIADRLQLLGPDFATEGLEGIPFGSVDQDTSCMQLRVSKHSAFLEILVQLEKAKCTLRGDYLAVIVGFIISSDWQASSTSVLPAERPLAVQYAVEVRSSLLQLPTGGGTYTEIVIPEFDFVFFPPEFDVCHVDDWTRTYEVNSKLFCIRGKQLSLSTCDERCLPFINCLDGKITVEVPVKGSVESDTVIFLRFPFIELFIAGKAFLEQVRWIEVLSTDLALVGKKASFCNAIWESLKTGKPWVLDLPNGEREKSSLKLDCRVDELRSSVFLWRKENTWENILIGEAVGIRSYCLVKDEVVDSLAMTIASFRLLDGGGNASVPQGLKGTGKRLLSISVPSEIIASKLKIGVTFPKAEVLLQLSSWTKVLSWIFLCFPMLPTPDPVEPETTDLMRASIVSTLQLRIEVPELVFELPEFVPRGGVNGQKIILITSALFVDSIEFDPKCRFSARFVDVRAEATEGAFSSYPCFSGNSIQITGDLDVDLRIVLGLEFNLGSIDCWCSHPVLRFLSSFRMEPTSDGEDSLDLDIEVKAHGEVDSFSLLLTDGRWNYNCPLLELVLSRSSVKFSWSVGNLELMLTSLLEISYHNIQKAVWEPFLEPSSFTVRVNSDSCTKCLDVDSTSGLNLNVTESLSQVIRRTAETIFWSKEQRPDGFARNSFSHYAPYWFQNDTGTVVFYTLIWPSWNEEGSDHLASDSLNWCTLLPGGSVPLFVDENEGRLQQRKARWSTLTGASERKKFGLMSHRRMRVQLEGTAAASMPMSIDLVGSRPLEVVFSKSEGFENDAFFTKVLFEVSLQHHSKLIRLRSIVALANMTSLAMEARLEIPFGIAPKIMEPIMPKEVVPLPVHLAETGRIRLRPFGKDFLWSEAHPLSQLISSELKSSQRPLLCYPARPSDGPFRCCVNVQEQLLSATKSPELSTENLGISRTWNLVLQAPFVVRNGFPCTLDAVIESGAGVNVHTSIQKGDCVSIYEVDVVNDLNLTFTIPKYRPSSLKFVGSNHRERTEISELVAFIPENSSDRHLYARVQKTTDFACGRREVSICIQYWIYNFTGLELACTDGELNLRVGKQLILSDGDMKNDSSAAAPTAAANTTQLGLQALFAAQENSKFGLKQPGKLSSHLPSSRFVSHVRNHLRKETSDEQVDRMCIAHLYSPGEGVERDDYKMRLCILQPLESSWTQPFLLDPPGGTSPIFIPQSNARGAYLLCLSSMPATGICSGKTKILTFRPRFVLANASRQDICFKQQGTDIVHHLPVGQNTNVHWTDTTRTLLLSVRYDEQGWDWSGGFALDRLGDTQVKAQNHLTGKTEILRVEVVYPDAEADSISGNERLGTFYVIVTNDETGFMPYRIDNFSGGILRFCQRRCEKRENILQPYSSCDFAWDEPCLPPQLVIEVPGEGSLGAYELENVKTYPTVHLGQKADRRFVVSVHAEGAKRVLSVTDLALHIPKDPKTLTPRIGEKLTFSALEKFTVKLACVGVSLVDSAPQELVFASARELSFQLSQNDREQDLKLEVTGLQIDSQLRHAAFPVMLSTDASKKYRSILSSERVHPETEKTDTPTVLLTVSKWRHPMGSVDCFQCIYLSIAPLRIELEERSLTRLIVFLKSFVGGGSMGAEKVLSFKFQPVNGSSDNIANSRFIEVAEAGYETVEDPKYPTRRLIISAKTQRKTYVEDFCIDPLELTISFSSIPWLPKEQRGVAAHSILWSTGSLLQRRLIALADVEGAPIHLRQLALAHPMANWNAIIGIMQRHYTRQLLHEVYKVLGSADVFGNPMSFMRSLGSGVWDFVSAPATSIRQNPVHIVQGVRLGTKSLFRNTVFAFSNAATQMSKAARKGVAVLALDHEYLEHEVHEDGRDSSVVNEFLEGLTGLLQSSVVGAERHGIPGVFTGMAVGILRAVARPAASMLEVAGKTARSIRNSSRPSQLRVSRVRLPRYLEQGSPLFPYSWNEALGMTVLLEAENGRLKDEVYITCQPLLEAGIFVLITGNYLLQVKASGREDTETERWIVVSRNNLEDILYMDRADNTLDVLQSTVALSSRGSSPFQNLSLQFISFQAADDVQGKLLELLNRKRNNSKLSSFSILRNT